MSAQPTLRTARLVLRPFRLDDAPALHRFLSDPEATRFWGDPHATLAETQALVAGTIAAPEAETCDFVIEQAGAVIGKMGMWRKGEIGFFLLPEHQRRGVATEAMAAVLAHLFDTRGEPVLTADTDPRNAPALALLARFGFRETGRAAATIRIGGAWCDSVYLALRRADWHGP